METSRYTTKKLDGYLPEIVLSVFFFPATFGTMWVLFDSIYYSFYRWGWKSAQYAIPAWILVITIIEIIVRWKLKKSIFPKIFIYAIIAFVYMNLAWYLGQSIDTEYWKQLLVTRLSFVSVAAISVLTYVAKCRRQNRWVEENLAKLKTENAPWEDVQTLLSLNDNYPQGKIALWKQSYTS